MNRITGHPTQSGFSLFELMIAVAVIGIISAFAVPAYRSYVDTANMTKVTANFEVAVRLAQGEFSQHKTRMAIGLPTNLPDTTQDWLDLLNRGGLQAPGGGPAFIESTNNQTTGRGDAVTGAVGVRWQAYRPAKERKNGTTRPEREARLQLWRPMYSSLREQRANIYQDNIDITQQRKP